MKTKIFKIMAAMMAAIFVFGAISVSAAPSYEKVNKDYRNMDILDNNGVKVNKPTAQFSANRIVNGEVVDMAISYSGYDCNMEIPTLVCYVGDTLTFTDMSVDNNGGKITEWDWQFFGHLGNNYYIHNKNIVNESWFNLTEVGETTFFLCVKNDANVKNGCCDSWSENGNHQVVGRSMWYPDGAYWYFTAIRVIVKPARDAGVYVRCWDVPNNRIFHEEYVSAGKIVEEDQSVNTNFQIIDWEGYEFDKWNIQLEDGIIQHEGLERNVEITLEKSSPQKYLNVEYYPYIQTEVEVRYWDKKDNELILTEKVIGEDVIRESEVTVSIDIKTPEGYVTDGWNIQNRGGLIYDEGYENPIDIMLNKDAPKKIVNVKCYPLDDDDAIPSSDITVKPNGICDGVIEWKEYDSHSVFVGYSETGEAQYETCNHEFDYTTVLGAEADVSPSILKSGYGFGVRVDCALITYLERNTGECSSWGNNRENTTVVEYPTTATVFIPWNMTNSLGTQVKNIEMEEYDDLRFMLPSSPVSVIGDRKIYTPVELEGTKENPKRHQFEIYVGGGGIAGTEFCLKLVEEITIIGDMYEDDFSGAN